MVGNWLITGGCGFLGITLNKHLLANNLAKSIRILDNLNFGTRENLAAVCTYKEVEITSIPLFSSQNIQLIVGDIRDQDTCENVALE